MNESIYLATVVRQFYLGSLIKWQPLHSDNGNCIYRLELADGQHWALYIFSADDQSVSSLAHILSFLERQGYLAEQIVHSVHNGGVNFAHAISRHEAKPYDFEWWWMRYMHADGIAERAHMEFAKWASNVHI